MTSHSDVDGAIWDWPVVPRRTAPTADLIGPNEMARIVKLTKRHDCREEIARDIQDHVPYFGTVVECSCGNQFTWSDDQRDGPYWADTPGAVRDPSPFPAASFRATHSHASGKAERWPSTEEGS